MLTKLKNIYDRLRKYCRTISKTGTNNDKNKQKGLRI
jgi:hypothetical protein